MSWDVVAQQYLEVYALASAKIAIARRIGYGTTAVAEEICPRPGWTHFAALMWGAIASPGLSVRERDHERA